MKRIINELKKRIFKSFSHARPCDVQKDDSVTVKNEDINESPDELTPSECDEQKDAFHLTREDSNLLFCGVGRRTHYPPSPTRTGKSSKYALKDKIGEGAYGKVYRSIDILTNKEYAIKISKLTDANRQYLLVELNLLRKLQSPYIVSVYDGFVVGSKLWLVMEHCIGGSILDVMKLTKKETLDEPMMKGVIGSLLLALDFLHGHRIIHRDIKASNLVLTMGGQVKLIDFGIATEIKPGEVSRHTVIGSPYWMAPEVIEGKPYDEKVDIWSLGMTILELCEPQHPLFCIHPVSVLFKIVTSDPPHIHKGCTKTFSLEFNHFFARCMHKDPAERPSSSTLLEHLWIKATVQILSVNSERSSSVASLEKLFMDYVLHEDVEVLSWDEEDELEARQEEGTEEPCSSGPALLELRTQSDLEDFGALSSLPPPPPRSQELEAQHSGPSPPKCNSASLKKSESLQLSIAADQRNGSERSLVTEDIFSDSPLSPSRQTSEPSPLSQRPPLHKRGSALSDDSLSDLPCDSPSLRNAHSHPSCKDSKPPSMLATPVSLRHSSSQTYIQRLLSGEGQQRADSTSYRSLGSFERGSYILNSRSSSLKNKQSSSGGNSNEKILSSSGSYDDKHSPVAGVGNSSEDLSSCFSLSSSHDNSSSRNSISMAHLSSSDYYADL